jgi:sensor domain CHASE-containing protein
MLNRKGKEALGRLLFPYLGVLLVVLGGILGTEYVAGLAAERDRESVRLEAQARLSELRAWLESEINSVLYLSRGLTAYIVARPDASPAEFALVAPYIVRGGEHIRNIGLGPATRPHWVLNTKRTGPSGRPFSVPLNMATCW